MGDSITDNWGRQYGKFFPGKPYINRGISGQTTPQMLIRFRPDVIALRPAVVVILVGTKDIAGNTGRTTLEAIEDNLTSMVELARANGFRVVLASLLPACDYIKPQTPRRPMEKIIALNAWIKDYAVKNKLIYLDYYSAMLDNNKVLKRELTYDGLHPNDAGYEVMGAFGAEGNRRGTAPPFFFQRPREVSRQAIAISLNITKVTAKTLVVNSPRQPIDLFNRSHAAPAICAIAAGRAIFSDRSYGGQHNKPMSAEIGGHGRRGTWVLIANPLAN